MKVALGQLECVVGDVPRNVASMVDMIRDAAGHGCAAVWFPELADTGYGLSVMRDVAGAWPGLAYDALAAAAKQHRITVGAGLSERETAEGGDTGCIFNSLAVFAPDGTLAARYRKTHLFCAGFADEGACFVPGHETVVTDIAGFTHGLSVCYDLRFPELYRALSTKGADVLVNATAWPSARPTHWDHLTRARAIENQAWFLGVARAGTDEGIQLNGRSRIVNPMGEVVVEAGAERAELVVGEIDADAIKTFRDTVPALAHRRRDLFNV